MHFLSYEPLAPNVIFQNLITSSVQAPMLFTVTLKITSFSRFQMSPNFLRLIGLVKSSVA